MAEEVKMHDVASEKEETIVHVRDVMDKVFLSVTPDMTVRDVFRLFIKRRLMAVPVVDNGDHLLGLISSADLMYQGSKSKIARSLPLIGSKIMVSRIEKYAKLFRKLLNQPCKKIMTEDVMITTPDADVEQVAAVMILEHLKVLPVIDNKRVVGMIHRGSILQLMYNEHCAKHQK